MASFRDEYFFLSNFYPCSVRFMDMEFQCSEGAFCAAQMLHKADRHKFVELTGAQAKKLAKTLPHRHDWGDKKLLVMRKILWAKFSQHQDLADKLLDTGDMELVELNEWHDTFWGVCNGIGENHLGKLLMKVRERLMENK